MKLVRGLIVSLCPLGLSVVSVPASLADSTTALAGNVENLEFSVPAGSLNTALDVFVKQSGVQLIYRVDEMRSAQSPGVRGVLTPEAALGVLLTGTGFQDRRDRSGAIAIVPVKARRLSSSTPSHDRAAAVAEESGADPGQLEEVVVSARRTDEKLQSVPVAVTVLSGQMLDKLNIQDATSVSQFTPNLSISAQPSSLTAASVYIRGIGNQEPSALAELGVGMYLDGVYVARTAGSLFDLVDMERIEVLRGPQGTLFGRNTIGGAVQLVSRKPADDMHVELKTGIGRYNDWFARGRLDTGYLGNTPLKASLTYVHRQRDGWFDNTLAPSSKDPGSIDSHTVAFALRGTFDALTADYTFDFDRRQGAPMFSQVVAASPDVVNYFSQSAGLGGAPFQIGSVEFLRGQQEGVTDRDGRYRFDSMAKVQGHAVTLEYVVAPSLTLKSISSYRSFSQDTVFSLSGNGILHGIVLDPVTFAPSVGDVTLYNGNNAPQRQHQVSQEFQALGKTGDFSYVAGAYYFDEKSSEAAHQILTFVLPGGQAALNLTPFQAFGGSTKSYALFGQSSYTPGGGPWEFTAGLRYTWDKKNLTLRGDVQPNLAGSADFTNLSWLASAGYKFSPDVMAYARVSTGYRSGGINPRVNFINVYQPEKALAFEAGLKAELFDRRLRTNVAVFHTDYKDLQLQQLLGGTGGVVSFITNAGHVNYDGVELEVMGKLTQALTLETSVGYTEPKYKTFLYRNPFTDQLINVANEAHLLQTSKFNGHAAIQYLHHLGMGDLEARLDYSYRSTIYYHLLDRNNPFNEDVRSRPDQNVAARLDLADIAVGGGRMEVGLWGDNLLDDKNINFGVDFGSLGFGTANFKKPRTYGIDVKFNY